jgi:hypothetical protein
LKLIRARVLDYLQNLFPDCIKCLRREKIQEKLFTGDWIYPLQSHFNTPGGRVQPAMIKAGGIVLDEIAGIAAINN